ncbi:MAG: hypothetical protein C0391_05490 [Anaerolinea sp.]|nr:hypothetical protein [Anaerolinea sp.]
MDAGNGGIRESEDDILKCEDDILKCEDDMTTTASTPEYTVYNKPPFINEILAVIRPEALTARDFRGLVEAASIYDINTMLMDMTREYDVSGMVPNLAGTCTNPQEVLKVYTDIAHQQLTRLAGMEPEIRVEVLETLTGSDFSMRSLVILDDIQRDVIGQLTTIRQGATLALAVRQVMVDALRLLYRTPIKIRSEIFDEALNMEELETQTHGVPRICYPRLSVEGEIREVWQYFHLPRVEHVRLPAHFSRLNVKQVLESLTPDFYIRDSKYDGHYDPESPVGFMGLLGKIGNALPRIVVEQVKRNARIKEMVMREDAISRALYELFTRYPQAR